MAFLGRWGWGEPQVTSVAMAPAGGLGSLTALRSGCALAFAFWQPLKLLGWLSAVGHHTSWVSKQNGCLIIAGRSPLPPLGRFLMSV